ncbi:MAG TPA: SDR family oxidoreductase [Bacteroidetes bacterium]|nr:SDR family oxidoreductase [Bacteroidota bacterium]
MNIVVTGASRGIGYELAKSFLAEQGNRVVAVARNRTKLERLNEEITGLKGNSRLNFLSFDLSQENFSDILIPFIVEKLTKVDVLVNNAGLMINKEITRLSDEDFNRLFNVNVKSVFKLVKDLLPYFGSPAHIVNISSMGGVQGSAKFKGLSLYSASKGALNVLTECLAEELKDKNIKVNSLALGAVQTEMLSEAFPGYRAPMQPTEMARFIKDFAYNGHRFFNGKILPVSVSTP